MKKRILLGFGLLLTVFLAGSIIAWLYISTTASRMDRLLLLHQAEILREELIIDIQRVQSQISRSNVHSGKEVDVLIAHVQEMDKVIGSCAGCHHSPELMQGLLSIRDMANDYKTSISRLITAVANPVYISRLENRAKYLGEELVSMTQGMAFTANIRLQQKTRETLLTIKKVRGVLIATLLIAFLLSAVIVAVLMRDLNTRLRNLLDATRHAGRGDLEHRVETSGGPGDAFDELAMSFNTMIRNLQRSRRQLLQNARIAAAGECAAHIASEVSSPLTEVLGSTELLLKTGEIPADKKEHLRTIERESLRAREVLKNLQDLSRREPPRMVAADMAGIVEDSLALVKVQTRAARVEIRSECSEALPMVAMDSEEIKQVLMSLINHAVRAMPSGGTLTLQCGSEKDEAGHDMVSVSIAHTGPVIPEEQLDRIFDPFFTARTDREGPGPGLTASYLIVQNHGGRIDVESGDGTGATFRLFLPAAPAGRQ
jgi:signal transduction histidine kinase